MLRLTASTKGLISFAPNAQFSPRLHRGWKRGQVRVTRRVTAHLPQCCESHMTVTQTNQQKTVTWLSKVTWMSHDSIRSTQQPQLMCVCSTHHIGLAWVTLTMKASVVWPESVRPLLSTIVPETWPSEMGEEVTQHAASSV